ncbi:unnamed protein product [Cochlearia groenlandica]
MGLDISSQQSVIVLQDAYSTIRRKTDRFDHRFSVSLHANGIIRQHGLLRKKVRSSQDIGKIGNPVFLDDWNVPTNPNKLSRLKEVRAQLKVREKSKEIRFSLVFAVLCYEVGLSSKQVRKIAIPPSSSVSIPNSA